MPRFPLGVPSGVTKRDAFARTLQRLLGWNAPDGSNNASDLRALGGGLAEAHDTLERALEEAFPSSARELLSAWETRLGVAPKPGASVDTRRATLVAHRRASGGNTASRVLAAVEPFDPTAQVLTLGSANTVNPRDVFGWALALDPAAFADGPKRGRIRALVAKMKPAYSRCELGTYGDVFRTDDPDSLTDRDILGG